jgi:hypothetical protein
MNGISFTSPTLSPFHSIHMMPSSPVGEESLDMPASTLKPVEQLGSVHLRQDVMGSRERPAHHAQDDAQVKSEALAIKEERQSVIDQQVVKKLATLDREVRNHELAHAIVGGKYAGAPRYEYERGPDGIHYAVAGEVSISTSAVNGHPEMTIEKAQVIRKAALAPAEPSAQDRRVAMEAVRMEAEAHLELLTIEQEQRAEKLAESAENERVAKEENVMSLQESHVAQSSIDHLMHVEGLQKDDAMDVINQAQENVFNAIHQDLATQFVTLGGTQKASHSLGSIINRLA